MRKLWQTNRVKIGEGSIKSMKSRTQRGVTLNVYICVQRGGRAEKSVIRYVRNKWIARDNCCKILVAYWSRQVYKSITVTKKMSLFSSIKITIILFHAIIRINKILHIYLQVSKTEGLAELHWVTGLSVLEKILKFLCDTNW